MAFLPKVHHVCLLNEPFTLLRGTYTLTAKLLTKCAWLEEHVVFGGNDLHCCAKDEDPTASATLNPKTANASLDKQLPATAQELRGSSGGPAPVQSILTFQSRRHRSPRRGSHDPAEDPNRPSAFAPRLRRKAPPCFTLRKRRLTFGWLQKYDGESMELPRACSSKESLYGKSEATLRQPDAHCCNKDNLLRRQGTP